MARLEIRQVGDPVLRQVARRVAPEVLAEAATQQLIDDLVETMHAAHGAGLAAPQVGHGLAIAAVHVQDNPRYPYKPRIPLTVVVNPVLTRVGDETLSVYEGCLSVPDLRGRVRRHARVVVDALDRRGAPLRIEAAGLTAGTWQHELDHLDGRLFLDRVEDPATLCTWANFDRYHRDAFTREARAIVDIWGG